MNVVTMISTNNHKVYAKLRDDEGLLKLEPYFTSFDPRVIIREETPTYNSILNSYHIFSDVDTMVKWYMSLPEKSRYCHEVITPNSYGNDFMPQRFVFDIDCEKQSTSRDAMFSDFIAAIISTFMEVYCVCLSQNDIYWCDSSDDSKFSRHVYIDGYYAMNAYENKALVLLVNEKTGIRGRVSDDGIYTQNHCLRLVYSRKPNSNRIKLPYGTPRPISDYLVRLTTKPPVSKIMNKFSLPDIITDFGADKIRVDTIGITNIDVKTAVEMILRSYPQGCKFIRCIGNLLLFIRVAAADCPICKVCHNKDNTMYGYITNGEVNIMCRHSYLHTKDAKAKINVGSLNVVKTMH
ncbi:Putative helicase/primase complex protein [Faustovirus ST1]|nr:Putative helicase/primase complex protein [Faustovirus ST1]